VLGQCQARQPPGEEEKHLLTEKVIRKRKATDAWIEHIMVFCKSKPTCYINPGKTCTSIQNNLAR
jgi:hypothetical protein